MRRYVIVPAGRQWQLLEDRRQFIAVMQAGVVKGGNCSRRRLVC
jgi:hypothetical protein